MVECNEVAVRHFLKGLRSASNPQEHVFELSEEYQVRVNDVDVSGFTARTAQWYILSVYQQVEYFFISLKREHPQASWPEKQKGEDPLDYLIRSFDIRHDITSSIGDIRLLIFKYYRLVRNRFMHIGISDEAREKTLAEIKGAAFNIGEIYKVDAPNSYDKLNFDDFILFTRVTKDIALWLCQVARPSDSQIVEMLVLRDKDPDAEVHLSGLRKFLNNEDRLRSALRKLIRYEFGLLSNEADPIIDQLTNRLGC